MISITPNEVNVKKGEVMELKDYMKMRGIKIGELAPALGVSRQWVHTKMKEGKFTFEDSVKIKQHLRMTDNEYISVFGKVYYDTLKGGGKK